MHQITTARNNVFGPIPPRRSPKDGVRRCNIGGAPDLATACAKTTVGDGGIAPDDGHGVVEGEVVVPFW